MKVHKLTFVAAVLLYLVGVRTPVYAQLEPDKKIASVGKWSISTARYGIGCVADLDYDDGYELSISGESFDKLTLLITVRSKWFSTKLDGSEERVPAIEIALANNRWGNVQPYGYRGTPGIVLAVDNSFLGSFVASEKIKVTELGHEKLSINLENPGQVIDSLRVCFKSGGASSTASQARHNPMTLPDEMLGTWCRAPKFIRVVSGEITWNFVRAKRNRCMVLTRTKLRDRGDTCLITNTERKSDSLYVVDAECHGNSTQYTFELISGELVMRGDLAAD